MDVLDAILLGIVQGITEFLPVSSDGHLALAQWTLGLRPSLSLSVLLHAGTLAVVVVGFRRELASMVRGTVRLLRSPRKAFREPDGRLALLVLAASAPTAAVGLALRDVTETWTGSPGIVAGWLAVTAVVVATTYRRDGTRPVDLGRALAIGVAQGLAVLPGLSRSGSTIALALLLGVRRDEAARFSFAASIPAVAGALVLEVPGVDFASVGVGPALLGVGAAFLSGAIALRVLLRLVHKGHLWGFALYLVPLAIAVWLLAP